MGKRIGVTALLSIFAFFFCISWISAIEFNKNKIHWEYKNSYVAYGIKHPKYPGKEFPIKRYFIQGCTIDINEHENTLEIDARECDWSKYIQPGEIEQHITISQDASGKAQIKHAYYQWNCEPGIGCKGTLIGDKYQKDIFQAKYLQKAINGDLPKEVKKLFYGFYGIQ